MTPQTALAPREQHNQITTSRAQDIDIFIKQAAAVIGDETIRNNKITEIEAALSSEAWTMTEDGTTEFLAKFTGGEIVALADMSGDEMDAVIAELVELGNLPM